MEHIRQTLEEVIKDIGKGNFSEMSRVFKEFRQTLGKTERKHAKCANLRAGVLTVNVDSSVWLYQLSLKKEEFLRNLGVKDIRFRIGEVK
jgi:predicted nucleic acid-binding Zn ribbon protein